ncbi:hypothetical protein AS889_13355 [Pseudomonas putida]|uniref:hypothetical protein n=1 Tax=Pseudomonas putida TaxID=303 RepID=UPI0007717136|nr:hypothetical protein [Pseudomonas putida]KWW14995.1 hypothetical protein AS889_13355 [Pseudomonas putida]
MQPYQYALSAGIVLLFVLAILPYLLAGARRRAHEEGKEIGLAERNATHAQRIKTLNEELAELAVQREADQRNHLKTVANLKLTISELEARIMSYTGLAVSRADYELLISAIEILSLTERTLDAMKATQQATRAALQATQLRELAKRIHTQLRETPASTTRAEVAA